MTVTLWAEWTMILRPEHGSKDPGEQTHRDGCRRPNAKDLSERALRYGCVPFVVSVGRVFHQAFAVNNPNSASAGMRATGRTLAPRSLRA